MTANPATRRSTRALYEGQGIVVGRVENERRLLHGIRDSHAFVVPKQGAWEFLYRGGTYLQRPGILQLKQPGELIRDLRRDGPARYDIVIFAPALIARAASLRTGQGDLVFAAPQLPVHDPRARALMALHALTANTESAARPADALTLECAVAEATQVLVALMGAPERSAGSEHYVVKRAKAYLRERLHERVRLDDLADHVRLDKYHLIRAFRAQVGVPPYEYLTHLRVQRARELLREGELAANVAPRVGFCDQSQLHRHFVKLVGLTPGRYAASMRSAAVSVLLGMRPLAMPKSRTSST